MNSCARFSIVTPAFNSERFISETIESVISQVGNFSIEYVVMDGGSTDRTREIVQRYQKLLLNNSYPIQCNDVVIHFYSERDDGMYDAINKGFEKTTGDINAWLNADDIYLPGALATIAKVFTNYEDVHWVKGITSYVTEKTLIWEAGECLLYMQDWIKAGIYGRDHCFIQQDSVFWRAWVWKKCGGIDTNFKRAGDYYLWIKFAELAPLITVRSWVSCFRSVEGQLSQDLAAYIKEVKSFSLGSDALSTKVRLFLRFERRLPAFVKPCLFRLMFNRPEFSVVLISADGKLNKITGKYYDVLSLL